MRYVTSGYGRDTTIRSGIDSHDLDKSLVGHYILCCLKHDERLFVNEMTKYSKTPRYILNSLKDRDPDNLTSTTHV